MGVAAESWTVASPGHGLAQSKGGAWCQVGGDQGCWRGRSEGGAADVGVGSHLVQVQLHLTATPRARGQEVHLTSQIRKQAENTWSAGGESRVFQNLLSVLFLLPTFFPRRKVKTCTDKSDFQTSSLGSWEPRVQNLGGSVGLVT